MLLLVVTHFHLNITFAVNDREKSTKRPLFCLVQPYLYKCKTMVEVPECDKRSSLLLKNEKLWPIFFVRIVHFGNDFVALIKSLFGPSVHFMSFVEGGGSNSSNFELTDKVMKKFLAKLTLWSCNVEWSLQWNSV